MKVIVSDWHTDIFPTDEEVKEHCKIGAGKDTCIWLLMGPDGWECCCLHRPHSLMSRWEKGETVAKRDGCEKVQNFSPMDASINYPEENIIEF